MPKIKATRNGMATKAFMPAASGEKRGSGIGCRLAASHEIPYPPFFLLFLRPTSAPKSVAESTAVCRRSICPVARISWLLFPLWLKRQPLLFDDKAQAGVGSHGRMRSQAGQLVPAEVAEFR